MGHGLASFAAGFGGGYLQQTRQNKLDAERQEDRAMVKADYDDKTKERNRVEGERAELATAGKTAVVNQAAQVDGLSTKPVMYENADVAAGDLRQDRNMRAAAPGGYGIGAGQDADASQAQPGATALPAQPVPAPPTMKKEISVNGKQYGNTADADAAAKTLNDGRGQRIIDTLNQQGRVDTALNTEAAQLKLTEAKRADARKLISEGIEDVATAARGGDPRAVMNAMNKQGEFKLTEPPVVRSVVRDIPGIGPQQTYDYDVTIVGPDGKTVKKTVNSHDLSMMGFNAKETLAAQMAAAKEKREGLLGDAHAKYYNAAGEAMLTKADTAADKVGNALNRMSAGDQAQIKNLNSEHEKITSIITKGIADGTLDEKSPQLGILKASLSALGVKQQVLYAKAEAAGGGPGMPAAADALGVRSARTTQPSYVTGKDMGTQRSIIEPELAKATAHLNTPGLSEVDRINAQDEVNGLTRELARLPGGIHATRNAAAPVTGPGVTQRVAGNPAPAAPAAAVPAPPAARPASPLSPRDALGAQLDAARVKLQAVQSERRPGLAAGAAALETYSKRLAAAKQEAADLQSKYEVSSNAAPFFGKVKP